MTEKEIREARELQRFFENQSKKESNGEERDTYYNYQEREDEGW
ncbi:hypothetical protein KNT81_gp138 [Proteus phage phiP4-3]|uniref:Uncharacterized protein n=1 Tax=Proteus phage phiP4-3 TaxID=2065203 RepID=A0A2I6PFI8_9CAUD|nr:hypothetical protein KNT81_gp138 [Proteus phage phiP4-3]AUM58496.1 hypothetical protein phiP43_138 [Proteus phage phiP4-3]